MSASLAGVVKRWRVGSVVGRFLLRVAPNVFDGFMSGDVEGQRGILNSSTGRLVTEARKRIIFKDGSRFRLFRTTDGRIKVWREPSQERLC